MDLRRKMLEMLDCTRVEELYELFGDRLIAVSIAAMNNSNVYIVAENDLHLFVRLFKSWDLHVCKVVCALPKDFQKVDDVEIVSPESLLSDDTPRKFFFLIEPDYTFGGNFFETRINEIPFAETQNNAFIVHTQERKNWVASLFKTSTDDKMFYFQSHKRELMDLFDSLADETSKRALFYYVESYVRNCIYRGAHALTRWKYFFGGKYERLYEHLDGEVWINCGANTGDTVFQYLSFDFKPKKIFAFEGDAEYFSRMLNNLSFLPTEKRALIEPINEMIDETTDFEKILRGDKCTLLNADIEGAELPFLHATKKIIRSDRPVIAICVYHRKEDLLTIPQFLQSICTDYIFYLRKYTPNVVNLKRTGELVFYAVPKERAVR